MNIYIDVMVIGVLCTVFFGLLGVGSLELASTYNSKSDKVVGYLSIILCFISAIVVIITCFSE